MGKHGEYRPLVGARAGLTALAAVAALILPAAAEAECRLALALGLDVSGSVDAAENALQRNGLAAALMATPVRAALLSRPEAPPRLMAFEWSGQADQAVLVGWTEITDAAALEGFARRIAALPRTALGPETAIGSALIYGQRQLASQAGCWQLKLDLAGDGKSNTGPRPRDVPQGTMTVEITVNGLAIEGDTPDLTEYYREEVIRGPGAFVETARGFADFEAAMTRKLLREVEARQLARAVTVAQ